MNDNKLRGKPCSLLQLSRSRHQALSAYDLIDRVPQNLKRATSWRVASALLDSEMTLAVISSDAAALLLAIGPGGGMSIGPGGGMSTGPGGGMSTGSGGGMSNPK